METYRIEHYVVEVENDGKKPGDTVDVSIKSEHPNAKYASVYRLVWYAGDNAVDMARRAFAHYKMGTRPDEIINTREMMSSKQIRASIDVNKGTFEQASQTLRNILDEPEPRRPYYFERLIGALNLCTDVAKHRAKLEFDLQKAIQAGR